MTNRRQFPMKFSNPGFSAVIAISAALFSAHAQSATISANPTDYLGKLANLQAGDVLELSAGSYVDGFNISDRIGTPDAWITIQGPVVGAPAIIEGRSCCNTVQLRRSEYIKVKNLTIDGKGLFVDGVNAKDGISHHIVIENNTLINLGAHQQLVGISTKSPAWDWVIRNNRIIGAGTGIYLGNSTGSSPFIGGIIEGNYIVNPVGYCMEIKHQNERPLVDGIPTEDRKTIIRNNVFIKDDRPSPDGNRPNLLVDGFPDTGNGSNDIYEIYGNFLYNNPRESLIQASGRVVFHDNVLVQPGSSTIGMYLTSHNKPLKLAYVYNNTVFGGSSGIRFGVAPSLDSKLIGNVVFSNGGIGAIERVAQASDNIVDTVANAVNYVTKPNTVLGDMNFYPLPGKLKGPALDLSAFTTHVDFDLDFNGVPKGTREYRGAYAGEGSNPGWQLQDSAKVVGRLHPLILRSCPAPPPASR